MEKKNIIVAICFSLFAVFVLILTGSFPASGSQQLIQGASIFPQYLSYAILVLSAILFTVNWSKLRKLPVKQKNNETEKANNLAQLKFVGGGFLIILFSVILLVIFGFIISMIIMNFIFMLYFKAKGKIILILEPLLTAFIIYSVFKYVLNIPLPRGILF